MKKGNLTLESMQELYDDVLTMEEKLEPSFILVPKSLKIKFDKAWMKLPWYTKLQINIKRIIMGKGLYLKKI